MTIWFTSDLHLSHKNILQYNKRPFKDVDDMNEQIVNNINSVVKPGDSIYILGDIIFGKNKEQPLIMEKYFSQMNGQKYLIRGNHDYSWRKQWFSKHFVWIKDYYELRIDDKEAANGKFNKIVMMHYPIFSFNNMAHGWWHIHGHCHGSIDEINRTTTRIDVGLDAEYSNYKPLSYEQIKCIMKEKRVTIVDHHKEDEN